MYISGDWCRVRADDIPRGHIIFLMCAAPLISNVAPNSKQVKCIALNLAIPIILNIIVRNKSSFSIDISVEATCL